MRYSGSEKLEIIRLVEHSHLPVRRTLATLGILPMTFYRWYARLQAGGRQGHDHPKSAVSASSVPSISRGIGR
jgi:transposase-like protein